MLYCIHPNLADLPLRPAGIVINQKPQNSEIAPVTAPILEKCINHRLANRSLPPPSCTQSTEPAIPFFFYLILAVVLFVHNAAAHCFHEEMERPREGGQKGRGERHLAAYIHSVVIIAVVGRGGGGGGSCLFEPLCNQARKKEALSLGKRNGERTSASSFAASSLAVLHLLLVSLLASGLA